MDAFKVLLWDTIVKSAISRLFIIVPFLGYPIIGTIVSVLIVKFTDIMYAGIKMAINLNSISIANEELRIKYNDSAVRLHIIANDKGITSKEFIDERKKHQDALSSLVRFNIS
jgi:hypothetical protein